MPTIDELVDELRRLKPGSPALHHFERVPQPEPVRPAPACSVARVLVRAQLERALNDDDAQAAFSDYTRAVVALLRR